MITPREQEHNEQMLRLLGRHPSQAMSANAKAVHAGLMALDVMAANGEVNSPEAKAVRVLLDDRWMALTAAERVKLQGWYDETCKKPPIVRGGQGRTPNVVGWIDAAKGLAFASVVVVVIYAIIRLVMWRNGR